MQVARIEASKYRIKKLWDCQSEKNKWIVGISALTVVGLVLFKGQKLASPGVHYLRQMLSTFVLVSKVIAATGTQVQSDEDSAG